ncbi:MAG TPA: DNA adenine methylase, partial [Fimbriimonadaceae bacterium]|nr:DNA adenine methylase [Fimbriimonadaceae bacterium]
MIKYLGSKRVLLPNILAAFERLDGVRSVIDLFSGTSRVGHALKGAGYRVLANDVNAYAHQLALCYVQGNREDWSKEASERINDLNRLAGCPGFFTHAFCEEARYFQPKNGARIDAMRDQIEDWNLAEELKAILLVSLIEAADRVDSTTGLQMAYLKQWAKRSANDIELRLPDLLAEGPNGKGRAFRMDAIEAAKTLSADAAYLDPPYNQHSYLGNYHVWETLVLWDQPSLYGVANKREDVR